MDWAMPHGPGSSVLTDLFQGSEVLSYAQNLASGILKIAKVKS